MQSLFSGGLAKNRKSSGKFREITFLLGLILACAICGRAADSRIAIIGPPELEKESFLLTTELSKKDGVKLVEREAIDRIFQEQDLVRTGRSLADSLRLGQMLKADGLVLLEKSKDQLTMRLVSVDSGAILAYFSSPFPMQDPENWGAAQAEKIALYGPKFSAPKSSLVPLSLLPVNSASGGSQGKFLEENINFLLISRLSVNPGIVTLERARLQEAVTENELNGTNATFWNSAWVIDGNITESSSGYFLDLRLQPPAGKLAQEIKIESKDISTLIETANAKILQLLGQPMSQWNTVQESARLLDEARWAGGNHMLFQEIQALEAAIALGDHSSQTLQWRWHSYVRMAETPPLSPDAPAASQLLAMAKSLQLYGDILVQHAFSTQENPKEHPFSVLPRWTNAPDADGVLLLSKAAHLLELFLKSRKDKPLSYEDENALVQLRAQYHPLLGIMEKNLPNFSLEPARENCVPEWNPRIQAGSQYSAMNPFSLMAPNVCFYMERVSKGRVWETSPAAYFDFVRKCLLGDLPGDSHFFTEIFKFISTAPRFVLFGSPKVVASEWRGFGEELIKEKDIRLQIAGAAILCQTGAPVEGVAVFSRLQEQILNGRIPSTYIAEGLPPGFEMDSSYGNPNESRSKVTGELRDLVVSLLGKDCTLSDDVLRKFDTFHFTEIQAADLLVAFRSYQSRHPNYPENALQTPSLETLMVHLSKCAGEKSPVLQASLLPTVTDLTPSPLPTPAHGPAAGIPPVPSLSPVDASPLPPAIPVDRAWVARNFEDEDHVALIRYVLAAGNKIWLQVDYPASKLAPLKREFICLDIPSLKKRVIYRDNSPPVSQQDFFRYAPSFASDGEGIYFWNGQNICYARNKQSRNLNVPVAVLPHLWLVGDHLYSADVDGTILGIDPGNGSYEILASARRRPPLTKLDSEEHALQETRRIFRAEDGVLAASLGNGTVYTYQDAAKDWQESGHILSAQNPSPLLPSLLKDAWDRAGQGDEMAVGAFLKGRYGASDFHDPSGLGKYIHSTDANPRKHGHSFVTTSAVVIAENILWALLEDRNMMGADSTFWLLRLDLASNKYVSRPLDFSPEYRFYLYAQDHTERMSLRSPRLISTKAGLFIYAPNTPVLWFLPQSEIPAAGEELKTPSNPSP